MRAPGLRQRGFTQFAPGGIPRLARPRFVVVPGTGRPLGKRLQPRKLPRERRPSASDRRHDRQTWLELSVDSAANKNVASVQCSRCTMIVATAPRPLSTRDSSTVPAAGASDWISVRGDRHQQNHFSSLFRFFFCFGGDLESRCRRPFLRASIRVRESWRFTRSTCAPLIDFVNRDNDGNARGLRMVDGFLRLRASRHHRPQRQARRCRFFRAARTHGA